MASQNHQASLEKPRFGTDGLSWLHGFVSRVPIFLEGNTGRKNLLWALSSSVVDIVHVAPTPNLLTTFYVEMHKSRSPVD